MTKKLLIALGILLLIPIPFRMKDGGTVVYKAILYQIEDVHRIHPSTNDEHGYLEGTIIKILGFEIYNSVS